LLLIPPSWSQKSTPYGVERGKRNCPWSRPWAEAGWGKAAKAGKWQGQFPDIAPCGRASNRNNTNTVLPNDGFGLRGRKLTGELRNQIDSIWNDFWTGGLSNPLQVIEQITYLIFVKRLDEMQELEERKATTLGKQIERTVFPEGKDERGEPYANLRWSRFKHFAGPEMFRVVDEHVFPFIRALNGQGTSYARHMRDARFQIPGPALLAKVVDKLDELDMGDRDTKGDVYEYMLAKIASAGQNGQFRTPRHITMHFPKGSLYYETLRLRALIEDAFLLCLDEPLRIDTVWDIFYNALEMDRTMGPRFNYKTASDEKSARINDEINRDFVRLATSRPTSDRVWEWLGYATRYPFIGDIHFDRSSPHTFVVDHCRNSPSWTRCIFGW
jgi:hypothetical protein